LTDSLYVCVDNFCRQHINEWDNRTDDEKIDIINEISENVRDYINDKVFNDVQLGVYNSTVEDFRIRFAREKIAKSGLFVAKKKYAVRSLWIEGKRTDKLSVTGLEIVRGDSSEEIRYRLKDIVDMILKEVPDEDITKRIDKYKQELMYVTPEGLAANIGSNNLTKWIKDGKSIKGTPWHIKGVANYRRLLKELNIHNEYEDIHEGMKVKVVYVKPNKWNIETISFYKWPKEFDRVIQIDKTKMIDKFFVKKISILLEPMNRTDMLNNDNNSIGLFFS
jgi:DNA polymerase elongation subunit (family B)